MNGSTQNKRHGRTRILLGVLLLAITSSCRYAGDRALDFLDQYRGAVGAGTVAGIRARPGGTFHTGLMIGMKPKASALGWRYGAPLHFDDQETRVDADQAQVVMTTSAVGLDIEDTSYVSAWNSFALLPAIFTWADSTPTDYEWEVPEEGDDFDTHHWLWSGRSFDDNRYAQIHAFDIELEVGLFAYFDIGFSPGEFVDFVLGIFTIDIAQDDDRI